MSINVVSTNPHQRKWNVCAIVQARLNSTRLPRKVARAYLGFPMLYHLCERLLRTPSLTGVYVACPMKEILYMRTLVPKGVQVIGPRCWEDDLVRRYLHVATYKRVDLVVRVPGDNPCVDPSYVEDAIQTYLRRPFLYYSNTTAQCGTEMVDGIGAEVFSLSRLEWLDRVTRGNDAWREHPHQYFVDQGLLTLPESTVRLDVNSYMDEELVKGIFDHFGHNQFTTQEALDALRNRT